MAGHLFDDSSGPKRNGFHAREAFAVIFLDLCSVFFYVHTSVWKPLW